MKKIYSFVGLPASGKDTQASIIAKNLGVPVWGVGDLIRDEIASNPEDEFVKKIEARYDKGIPQPDEVAIELVDRKLKMTDYDVVFSNFPFTQKQIDYLADCVDKYGFDDIKVIYIKISPETSVHRATSRRACAKCRKIYPADYSEPKCSDCGGELVTRSDDNDEVVKKRIEQYLPNIQTVENYYKNIGKLIEIDGENDIETVSKEVAAKI